MGRIQIKATFLDEVSTDIPHQNWGYEEWDRDFQAMKAIGIDTVVMIRCGLEKFLAYPSELLMKERGAYRPPVDWVEMFLELAGKYDMRFFFGTYVGHRWWGDKRIDFATECALDKRIVAEAWERYSKYPAFKGWYLSKEIATYHAEIVDEFVELGQYCKKISGNLPILISPAIQGAKAYNENMVKLGNTIDPAEHEADWDRVMARLQGYVDIIAFQDGHVEIELLPTFLKINKKLCDKYGIQCWTNTETFDRDMPIDFLPIKWEKLRYKLKKAETAGVTRALTFEFSHFMSPNSMYPSAHHLYNRYKEYLKEE